MRGNEEEKPLVFAACSKKQQEVLSDFTTDFLLTGGGAGGGKSRILLTKCLHYIQDPAAKVVILRDEYVLLKLAGGLISESKEIFPHFDGVFKTQPLEWHFPNGATIKFAAFAGEQDKPRFQGMAATHILIDEVASWSMESVIFLFSRLRSAKYKGHLSINATCNPLRTSFLYNWVEPFLDPATGIPRPDTHKKTRWFCTVNGKMHWGDDKEQLIRDMEDLGFEDVECLSFRFIPMNCFDNPVLLANNKNYVAQLKAQSKVDQDRYLWGSWTAQASTAGWWKREWCEVVEPCDVPELRMKARGWDLADSVVSETTKDPDYTAGALVARGVDNYIYIMDCVRWRRRTGDSLVEIASIAKEDGIMETTQIIQKDSGAAGGAFFRYMASFFAGEGVPIKADQMSGWSSKGTRCKGLMSLSENGGVRIVRGDWNEDFFLEMESFDGGYSRKARLHDDLVDACATAFNFVVKSNSMPTFVLPNLTRASPTMGVF